MDLRLLHTKKKAALALLLLFAGGLCASDPQLRTVRLTLHAPQAKVVQIGGNFAGWQHGRTAMLGPTDAGLWWIDLRLPLSLQRIEYVHWVDGEGGVIDPRQPVVQDGFGGVNNVLVLP